MEEVPKCFIEFFNSLTLDFRNIPLCLLRVVGDLTSEHNTSAKLTCDLILGTIAVPIFIFLLIWS